MKRILFSIALVLMAGFGVCIPAQAALEPGIVGKQTVLSAGAYTVAMIDSNDTLWMWGKPGYGMLGSSENISAAQSIPVKIMENVRSITLNENGDMPVAAAIKTDGSLWMWGCGSFGQLGDGRANHSFDYDNNIYQLTPIKIMDNVAAVSCSLGNTAVIKTDGSLWMWGDNILGQIGNGTSGGFQTTPVKVMDNVASVSCGNRNTAAVKTDGSLWMWGDPLGNAMNYGAPGDKEYKTTPLKIMDGVSAVYYRDAIAPPYVLKTDGTLARWPATTWGDPLPTEQLPLEVIARDVVSVSNGHLYNNYESGATALLKKDGTLWMFGDNDSGELGNADVLSQDYVSYENAVKTYDNVVAVTVCPSNVFVVTSNGTFMGWGSAISYEMSVNTNKVTTTRTWTNPLGQKITNRCIATPLPVVGLSFLPKVPNGNKVSTSSVPTVGGFTDVSQNSSFADAIVWAVGKNITTGKTDTTFAPGEECTNGQILTFLWRANGSPEPTVDNPFTDSIPASFQKAAVWAYEKGLVSGAVFGASTPCTRAVTVEYLWKAAGSPATSGNASFSDVPASADYAQAVAWAVENGVTSGTGNRQFSPDNTCTRGQIVTFLYRAMGK